MRTRTWCWEISSDHFSLDQSSTPSAPQKVPTLRPVVVLMASACWSTRGRLLTRKIAFFPLIESVRTNTTQDVTSLPGKFGSKVLYQHVGDVGFA